MTVFKGHLARSRQQNVRVGWGGMLIMMLCMLVMMMIVLMLLLRVERTVATGRREYFGHSIGCVWPIVVWL